MDDKTLESQMSYEIKIAGLLHEKWAQWLDKAMIQTITTDEPKGCTTITVSIPDQSALRGLLNKLWDLNLTVVSVKQKVK